jgi:hypothetical protein
LQKYRFIKSSARKNGSIVVMAAFIDILGAIVG